MSYIIGFFNKSKIQVSDEVGIKLQDHWLNGDLKAFRVNGEAYAFSGIEAIVSKDKAYAIFFKDFEQLNQMEDELISLPSSSNLLETNKTNNLLE